MFTPYKDKRKYLLSGILFMVLFFGMSLQLHASWEQNADGTYSYYKTTGTLVTNRWVGRNYYVDSHGIRVTGRKNLDSKWYYFAPDTGKLCRNKWVVSGKYKFYADEDGELCTDGIYLIRNHYYLFNAKGAMLTGRRTVDGQIYYFAPKTGRMKTSYWLRVNDRYYYFGADGIMVKKKWVENATYFIGAKGFRLTNRWRGTRYVGSDGKVCSGLHKIGEGYYYFDLTTHKKVVNAKITVDGEEWQFDSEGKGSQVKEQIPAPGPGVLVQSTYYTHPLVDDETLLSYIIYCEAGNQPLEGKIAVGYVIMNRVYSKRFASSTVREVVYERNQFNPTWDGAMARVYSNPSLVTAECRKAAKYVLKRIPAYYEQGKTVYLKIDGKKEAFPYLFFMTESSYRYLGRTSPYKKIGDHVFFSSWS